MGRYSGEEYKRYLKEKKTFYHYPDHAKFITDCDDKMVNDKPVYESLNITKGNESFLYYSPYYYDSRGDEERYFCQADISKKYGDKEGYVRSVSDDLDTYRKPGKSQIFTKIVRGEDKISKTLGWRNFKLLKYIEDKGYMKKCESGNKESTFIDKGLLIDKESCIKQYQELGRDIIMEEAKVYESAAIIHKYTSSMAQEHLDTLFDDLNTNMEL